MVRMSYVEDQETAQALRILAVAHGTSVSDLIRQSTSVFLARKDPNNHYRDIAAGLAREAKQNRK